MTTEQKAKTISLIMSSLKSKATLENRTFNEGVFFNLAFMSDSELNKIKKQCI